MTNRRYTYVDFTEETQVPWIDLTTGLAAGGLATSTQEARYSSGDRFEFYAAEQNDAFIATKLAPAATGVLLVGDNTAGDSAELTQGAANDATTVMKFTTGTDAFFIRTVAYIGLIANHLAYGVGFREAGAYVDNDSAANLLAAYDSKALLYVNDNAGTLQVATSANNVDTGPTALAHAVIANATWFAFEVNVAADRAITYRLGTSLVSAAAAYAALAADANAPAALAEDAQVWVPYISWIMAGGAAVSDIRLLSYECGLV